MIPIRKLMAESTPESWNSSNSLNLSVSPRQEASLRAGDRFANAFVIKDLLGQGGMALVYRAVDEGLGRDVAIKVIRDKSPDAVTKERFLRERTALGRLNHENVVRAHRADQTSEGQLFLEMELVDGRNLRDILQTWGRLPVADACEVARQAAEGLQALHEAKLVHRDIKPANLMLTPKGVVKLLDLGLVRLTDQRLDSITGPDQIPGSPDYMAPEHARDPSAATISADLYSLGCTLYCFLTDRPPFGDEQHQAVVSKLAAHQIEKAPPITGLRAELSEYPDLIKLLDQLLAKDPTTRPRDPRAVADTLALMTVGHQLPSLLQDPFTPDASVSTKIMGRPAFFPWSPTRTQWLRRAHLALIVVVCLAAVVAGGLAAGVRRLSWGRVSQPPGLDLASAPPTSAPKIQNSAALPESALRIESFEVEHRRGDHPWKNLGTLGKISFATQFNDHVRVTANLNAEAYCYLIALDSNGKAHFCPEAQSTTPPIPMVKVVYPAEGIDYFLDDDIGLQGFVLVASRTRLPAYADWTERSGLPWKKVRAVGVWWYNGREFTYLGDHKRGSERSVSSPVPEPFAAVCRHLRKIPDLDVIQAISFPVLSPEPANSALTRTGDAEGSRSP
jgi:serine/threonine protein kinase